MPDWTYLPLRNVSIGMFGSEENSRRRAMGFIRTVARLPGGGSVIRAFDYTHDHAAAAVTTDGATYPSPIGVVVSDPSEASTTVFRSMGYGFASDAESLPADAVVSSATTVDGLLADLDDGATLLVANDAVIAQGPETAQRVNEVLAARKHLGGDPEAIQWFAPWTWPGWVWAFWLGVAMVCAGLGASIIALGPVLLPYDEEFLRATTDDLDAINPQLVPFLQHDRITMAGCMMAIGFNDLGFAFAMRRGWRWARAGFTVAGAFGFPTFFLFLGYKFFDPLHFAVAVGFFPLYLGGVFGRRVAPTWSAPVNIDETIRRRAVTGQWMMVVIAVGVFLSGFVIMVVGLRDVLIPSDRLFLGDSQEVFATALDGRLLRFIAHDRAGFGGALASLGAGLITTAAWGWKAGERITWWMLVAASVAGLGAALVVHMAVGYTDFVHLVPVYAGMLWMIGVLRYSKPWFFDEGS